jgi:hypothetical protein
VGRSALVPFLPVVLWLRLAGAALLLASAPLTVLGLVGRKHHLRRYVGVLLIMLTLLGLVLAVFAITQLPHAGTTVNAGSLGFMVLCFIISSPMFSLGVALAALTVSVPDTPATSTQGGWTPAALAAGGFGAVSGALGVVGVVAMVTAPPPDCTGQGLACGVLSDAVRHGVLSAVITGTILIAVCALLEGKLGYWLSAILMHGQGSGGKPRR